MFNFSSFTMIKKLVIVAIAGIILSACAYTFEGIGKDMQSMGNSMGGGNQTNTNSNNQSQTKGKDVVVTPVK